MIKNAQVGGHKLYLTSLDVRTLGIAGGSMIVVEGGKISDVGPRSAHIADKDYEVFTPVEKICDPKVELIAPREDDQANYAVVACSNGESYALTLCGAANILGYVPEGDYAAGNVGAARKAWQALADMIGGVPLPAGDGRCHGEGCPGGPGPNFRLRPQSKPHLPGRRWRLRLRGGPCAG